MGVVVEGLSGGIVEIIQPSNVEALVVSAGPRGERGPTGASAYEIAVAEGFEGTQDEWLSALAVKEVTISASPKYSNALRIVFPSFLQPAANVLRLPIGDES